MFRPVSGAVVGSRYRLQQPIGWGSTAEIWRAHDLHVGAPCALKFVLGHLATDQVLRARLAKEGEIAARLRSPHLPLVLGVGEQDGAMYLAMELLEGEPLAARLGRSQLLSAAETLALLEQVASVLEACRAAGIVHRDLKPDNLWLCAGQRLRVKVLDFGLAHTGPGALQPALAGALVGTPGYMSPEQALAERDVDHRSDLWSLAIIAVECLTGKRPFVGKGMAPLLLELVDGAPPPLAELGPQLPPALEQWWRRALQRDPEQRFQSASELVAGLRRGLGEEAAPLSRWLRLGRRLPQWIERWLQRGATDRS
jgi:serine/threonine-protein kinase